MPEFILNGRDNAAKAESPFVLGFIEAMFFTESSCYDSSVWNDDETQEALREGQADGSIPNDMGYDDLEPGSLEAIRKFCNAKCLELGPLLVEALNRPGYDETQAGRDLWYTYNGHGVGYWDREALEADGLGDKLSKACGRGEISPFFGDHVEFGNAPFVHVDGL